MTRPSIRQRRRYATRRCLRAVWQPSRSSRRTRPEHPAARAAVARGAFGDPALTETNGLRLPDIIFAAPRLEHRRGAGLAVDRRGIRDAQLSGPGELVLCDDAACESALWIRERGPTGGFRA